MDRTPSPLQVALVVVAAIAIVAAGGFALLSEEPTRPSADVVENATERYQSLDGFTARVESTTRTDDETVRDVRRIAVRPGTGQYRSESLGGNASGSDLTVSNGTVTWYYDRENDTVQRTRMDSSANGSAVVAGGRPAEQLLRAAFEDTNETAPAISALPMGSASSGGRPSGSLPANRSATEINVTYDGIERLGDRDAYALTLRQTGGGAVENYSGRAWIDTEWFFALRQRTNFTVDGQRYETDTRYRNVSFEPGLDDEQFRFEPPDDATVRTSSTTQYDSREALVAAADLSVPEPEVPASFAFERGSRIVDDRRSVSVQYTNGTATLNAVVRNGTSTDRGGASDDSETRSVEIDGADATVESLGAAVIVEWECSNRTHSVIGSGVDDETVIDAARSVGCG